MELLPHPGTGHPLPSPAVIGGQWPGDPSDASTPVARSAAGVVRRAGVTSLEELDARVSACAACPRLVRWREDVAEEKRASFADQPYWGRPAPGWGDRNAHTLIVGLAPAAHGANRTGRIFTGDRSGDFLYAALHRAGFANQPTSEHSADGLALTGVRITAPVHCAPPQNMPTTAEKATCAPWLDAELTLLEPQLRTLVALGGIAWAETIKAARRLGWTLPRPSPKFGHGSEAVLITAAGRPITLLGCYHVSQQNTFTGRLTPQMMDEVFQRLG